MTATDKFIKDVIRNLPVAKSDEQDWLLPEKVVSDYRR